MKKLLFGCLLLLVACQTATLPPTPTAASLFPTDTPRPVPPETSTPQPAPMPTLEPSPTALPRFFVNEFDASLAGWVILQAGNDSVPNIKTEDGTLFLQIDSPFTWLYTLYGPEEYADVRIDAQFTNRANVPAAVGLVCRYSDEQGWFEFNASTDGTYNILYGKWLSLGIAEYLPVVNDASSKAIQPSDATQTLRLLVERFKLEEGKIGLTVSSFQNVPVAVSFDWAKVGEP
ncbi:MAG: hypothetical protein B6D38_07975 [Anaerolineae bacterium UTCFX1]|nr:MAG: hypothetical protein B6D38_07975 [Anaerolineae bacterium UTCFX1]